MSGRRPSLLIVDDDADIRDLVTMLFEHHGYDVDAHGDGIEALQLEKRYDVILLDLNMPVFDGVRLTDYWSHADPDIMRRVIVLSGYSRYTRGRELAEFARVRKPFEIDELLAVVERCLAAQHSEQLSRI